MRDCSASSCRRCSARARRITLTWDRESLRVTSGMLQKTRKKVDIMKECTCDRLWRRGGGEHEQDQSDMCDSLWESLTRKGVGEHLGEHPGEHVGEKVGGAEVNAKDDVDLEDLWGHMGIEAKRDSEGEDTY